MNPSPSKQTDICSVRQLLIPLLGAAVATFGCAANHDAPGRTSPVIEEIPILWSTHGTYSRLQKPLRVVARDAGTLAQLPLTDVPVDFSKQMVLIAALGPTLDNEFGIQIVRVWQEDQTIHVQERHIHPGVDDENGLEPASPWTIAVVPKRDANVEGYLARVPSRVSSGQQRPR